MKLEEARKILGVTANSTPAEIKKAYQKLASKLHPDKGGNAEEFKRMKEAYERITKPEQFAHENIFTDNRNRSGGNPFGFRSDVDPADIDALREAFAIHVPVHFSMNLTLEELYEGCNKAANILGLETFMFKIPAGTLPDAEIASLITLPSGKKRNMVCHVKVMEHEDFELDGFDLRTQREISLLEYYSGTTIKVKTLDGITYNVKVQANKHQQIIRMPKKGFHGKKKNGLPTTGDLYILVNVRLPDLNEDQLEQLKTILQTPYCVI